MLVDAELTASRWQSYFTLILALLVTGLLWFSNFAVWYKLLSILVFIMALLLQKKYGHIAQPSQLWQIDSQQWALRYAQDTRIYQAQLVRIKHYMCLVTLDLSLQKKKKTIVIWRDQVNDQQWRYLSILARLKRNNVQTPYD